MKLFLDDEAFDGQLQRSVAKGGSGMANVGECLEIASQISSGDRDSWYTAWSSFAQNLTRQADAALVGGFRISARDAYLRAAEYFRQAFFFHRDDLGAAELRNAYPASVDAFRKALPFSAHPGEVIEGDTPGYLFTPASGHGPYATILHIDGYDGTAEELCASAGFALERGYAFAALDGPGQGSVLYDQREPMRPDWENVIPAMIDVLLTRESIDPNRIVLVGRSFGGLIAPRGAAADTRVAAMIVDPGQYDLAASIAARVGDLWNSVNDPAADAQFESLLTIPSLRAILVPRMVTHGTTTVRAYFADLRRYHNKDAAAQVRCPTFVADNETDIISTGQGQELFDHLTAPKTFRRFTKAEGAEGHCEGMAPIVFWTAAFDWLDTTLGQITRHE